MKRIFLLIALVLALFALAGGSWWDGDVAEAGTVVIAGTEGGGVGPDSPSDGGGSYYCGNSGTNGLQIVLWPSRFVCHYDYHYTDQVGSYWSPTFGMVGGCGPTWYPCWHYHWIGWAW